MSFNRTGAKASQSDGRTVKGERHTCANGPGLVQGPVRIQVQRLVVAPPAPGGHPTVGGIPRTPSTPPWPNHFLSCSPPPRPWEHD